MMARGDVMNRPPREQGTVGLLAAILADTPRLDGALCVAARGRFWEAENGNRVRVRECIEICRRCPCLARCREVEMPYRERRNRSGVWAGKFYGRENETASETGCDDD